MRATYVVYPQRDVATSSSKPLKPDREQRRALLSRHFLGVVEPLLEAGESYAEISVERLITAVGISRSSFYAYFEDKGDLLGAMAHDVTEDLVTAGTAWFELSTAADKAHLRDSLRPLFETYRRHQALLGAISEAAAYDASAREQHLLMVDRAVDGLDQHIRDGQKAGAIAPELDARQTAQWLTWMHERGLYQLVSHASKAETRRLLDSMTDLVWRALYEGHRAAD